LGNALEPPCDLRKSTDEVRTSLIKVRFDGSGAVGAGRKAIIAQRLKLSGVR
jgi:hypothetical protein